MLLLRAPPPASRPLAPRGWTTTDVGPRRLATPCAVRRAEAVAALSAAALLLHPTGALALEGAKLEAPAALAAGATVFDGPTVFDAPTLGGMLSLADTLSTSTIGFADEFLTASSALLLGPGVAGASQATPVPQAAARVSRQAMAVASEALRLAALLDAEQGSTGADRDQSYRALLRQIEEVARSVSALAGDIAGDAAAAAAPAAPSGLAS